MTKITNTFEKLLTMTQDAFNQELHLSTSQNALTAS